MGTDRGRDALTLHCSSCGAPFAAGATRCGHCAAEITLEERNLDALCDGCGARMSRQARFCMRCGKAAALQPVAPIAELGPCPRCRGRLRERRIAAGGPLAVVVECGACGGLWLSPAALDRLCASAEQVQAITLELVGTSFPPSRVDPGRVTYLACPRCRDRMVRRNFGGTSGVIVDLCRLHGVWLDHAELEKVLEFVRAGGLMQARRREVDRLERQAKEARERRLDPGPGRDGPHWGGGSLGGLFGNLFSLFD
jgi:Zn-finger nucleic acid-binding protein